MKHNPHVKQSLKLVLTLFTILVFNSLSAQQQQVVFQGNAGSTAYDGHKIKLYQYSGMPNKNLDLEATVKEGKFEIVAPFSGLGHYIMMSEYESKTNGAYSPYVILVEQPGTVHIKTNMGSLYESTTTGSNAQHVVETYNKEQRIRTEPLLNTLREKYGSDMLDNPRKYMSDPKFEELNEEYVRDTSPKITEVSNDLMVEFVDKHPESVATAYLLSQSQIPVNQRVALYSKLSPAVQNSVYGKELKNNNDVELKSEVGSQIVDFRVPTKEGETLSLSQLLKGKKYLFVDFWASWCGPCLAEFPNLKKAYSTYKDKGLEVWGISTDSSREKWLVALENNTPDWPQAWEGGMEETEKPSKIQFSVPFLPSTYLLDAAGKIVAKNVRGEALEKLLAELLAD